MKERLKSITPIKIARTGILAVGIGVAGLGATTYADAIFIREKPPGISEKNVSNAYKTLAQNEEHLHITADEGQTSGFIPDPFEFKSASETIDLYHRYHDKKAEDTIGGIIVFFAGALATAGALNIKTGTTEKNQREIPAPATI